MSRPDRKVARESLGQRSQELSNCSAQPGLPCKQGCCARNTTCSALDVGDSGVGRHSNGDLCQDLGTPTLSLNAFSEAWRSRVGAWRGGRVTTRRSVLVN